MTLSSTSCVCHEPGGPERWRTERAGALRGNEQRTAQARPPRARHAAATRRGRRHVSSRGGSPADRVRAGQLSGFSEKCANNFMARAVVGFVHDALQKRARLPPLTDLTAAMRNAPCFACGGGAAVRTQRAGGGEGRSQ
jgi:hypothetical protein